MTSALGGREWSASRPSRFTSRGKSPWYPLYKRLGGSQSDLEAEEKRKFFLLFPESNPGRLVLSPSLYRLRYLDPKVLVIEILMIEVTSETSKHTGAQ
jgi:hypothetical protein